MAWKRNSIFFLPLNILCSLLLLFEFANFYFLVEQEGILSIFSWSNSLADFELIWHFAARILNIIAVLALWLKFRFGLFALIILGIINILVILSSHYYRFGVLGEIRPVTWIPLLAVLVIGIPYFKFLRTLPLKKVGNLFTD